MNRLLALGSVLLLAVTLSACSASGGDGRTCESPPADLLQQIADGASGSAIAPGAAAAVKSEAFDNAYIVAMRFTAADVDGEVGAWAVTSLDAPTSVLSVDGMAHQFTSWPNQINGESLSVTEDGVTEAIACLDAQ